MNTHKESRKDKNKKSWHEQTQDIFKSSVKYGMAWQSKVYMRCTMEGCVYGNPLIDKEPKEYCIYCGEKNPQILESWMQKYIKPIKK